MSTRERCSGRVEPAKLIGGSDLNYPTAWAKISCGAITCPTRDRLYEQTAKGGFASRAMEDAQRRAATLLENCEYRLRKRSFMIGEDSSFFRTSSGFFAEDIPDNR